MWTLIADALLWLLFQVEDKFVAYGIMMQESGQTNPKAQQFIETLGGNLDKIIESGSSTKIPGI